VLQISKHSLFTFIHCKKIAKQMRSEFGANAQWRPWGRARGAAALGARWEGAPKSDFSKCLHFITRN
jgi:hypothetical protein